MKRFKSITIPVIVAGVFLLPLRIVVLAQEGQSERVLEIEIGKAETAKAQLDLAHQKHFDERDFLGAIASYEKVITDFPNSEEATEAQFQIANIYHRDLIEPERAIVKYQKVIDKNPRMDYVAQALIGIGESYTRLKAFDRTISYFQQVIDQYPESGYAPEAKIKLAGTIFHDMHQLDEAMALYQEVADNHPNTKYAIIANLWQTYIRQANKQITDEEALGVYRQIIAKHGVYNHVCASAQYMIGFTYHTVKKVDKAIMEYQKILNNYLSADDDLRVSAHYSLGTLYIASRRKLKGIREFKKAIDQYPNANRRSLVEDALARAISKNSQ